MPNAITFANVNESQKFILIHIEFWSFCMLDEVSDFVHFLQKNYGCREFKKLCENLIVTKSEIIV